MDLLHLFPGGYIGRRTIKGEEQDHKRQRTTDSTGRDSQLQRADAEDLGETAGSHEDLHGGRPLGTRTRGTLEYVEECGICTRRHVETT